MNHDYPALHHLSGGSKDKCICDYKEVYNSLLNTSLDSVIIADLQGKILHISDKGLKLFGFENSKEILGRYIPDFVTPDEREKLNKCFEKLLLNNLAKTETEFSFLRKDKSKFYGEVISAIILDYEKKPAKIITIIKDITKYKHEQKKQEAIYEISEAASTSGSLDELYCKVHKIVKELIPAENFYISIYNEMSDTLSFPYYVDENDSPGVALKYGPQKFGRGLTEFAIKNGKPLLANKEKQIELLTIEKIDLIGELASEWLGVPLKTVDKKTIGLLAVQIYDKRLRYSQSDIDILSFVSTQIAMAIERKRKEESLSQLKKAVESSNEVIFITDPEGIIRYINPEFTNVYGHSADEVIGKVTPRILKSGLLTPERYSEFWDSLLNKRTVNGELINKTKDAKIIYIEGSASTILDEGGQIIGFLSVQRCINERKESEKIKNALYKISEAANITSELSNLYQKIHEIVLELMPVRNFYIALFDPESELISFPYFVDEFDPPQKPKKAGKGLTEYVLRTGKGILIDHQMDLELREKGEIEVIGTPSKIWLGVPLKIFERVTGVMVVQDYDNPNTYGEREKEILTFVSEQIASAIYKKSVEQELLEFTTELQNNKQLLEKRTEELIRLNSQLERSEKELQGLNASKDKYFSIIAHDLKSPFNGLLGFSNMLLKDFEQFKKDDVKNYLKYMNSSIKHIFTLVENLLDWSRIQTGKLEFNPEKLNLKDYVISVLKLVESNALNKGIKIITEIDDVFYVTADKKMLISVLQNLISNAIKFTKTGGEIRIFSSKSGKYAKISVCDNGVGIHQSRLKELFKIDSQISTDGTAKEKGTGLGLILCKEFIEKCGGTITVTSDIDKGSVFTFSLPMGKTLDFQ